MDALQAELRRFRESLGDAIRWHRQAPVPPPELRSPPLAPEWRRFHDLGPSIERRLQVETLIRRRRDRLPPSPAPALSGRLVWFDPDGTLSDGAAEQASDGYFDVDNVPAWDTWVHFRTEAESGLLLSWVPDAQVDLVSPGILANPEVCIGWARELQTPFAAALRREGLLL